MKKRFQKKEKTIKNSCKSQKKEFKKPNEGTIRLSMIKMNKSLGCNLNIQISIE